MSNAIRTDREERIARWRGQILPIISTIAGSAMVIAPMIADWPISPPFGLMMLLAWRLLRPELWPAWIGLPLGLIDDLFSGQPIGSAVFLWTAILIALDVIDRKLVWRDYLQDWLIAALAIILCISGGLVAANIDGGNGKLVQMAPQMILSILLFPAVARTCALLDRWRLS